MSSSIFRASARVIKSCPHPISASHILTTVFLGAESEAGRGPLLLLSASLLTRSRYLLITSGDTRERFASGAPSSELDEAGVAQSGPASSTQIDPNGRSSPPEPD
eukprot:9511199-Lingulodinium_polyedra.AAC.1